MKFHEPAMISDSSICEALRRWIALLSVLLAVAFVFFVTPGQSVRAEDPIVWQEGAKLSKALKSSVSFSWKERPLREGLTVLSRGTSVAIFLDRRFDSERAVTLQVDQLPLADAIKAIAAEIEGSIAMLGPVVYVAPRGLAPRVQALATLRQAEAAKSVGNWRGTEPLAWDDLAEPRELAEQIVSRAGMKLLNAAEIPHDVWLPCEGPALTSAQQLSLVLAGFDLTWEFEADGVKIVPAPESLEYEQTYTVAGGASTIASDLQKKLPGLKAVAESTTRIRVQGTAEQQASVADLLAGKRTVTNTVVTPGAKRYTLNVENQPIGAIVQTIAKELGVKVQAQEALVEKLKPRVNLEVNQVTAEELLQKVLGPAGMKFKLTEKTLELSE